MTINGFDELNTPKVQVEEPEEYFKKMDISPKQRKERVETSKELADVMLFLFALLAIEMQANKPNYPSVLRSFRQRFREVVGKHSRIDDYVENYINEFTGGVFDTTKRYMEAAGVGMDGRTDAGWWTSVDRATAVGENEANVILNHEELLEAVEAGAVAKSWSNVGDSKVRNSHKEVTKEKIPLTEYFAVGMGVMLYPCDWDNNPDECFNCRCSAIYYDEKGNIVKVGQGNRNTKVNKTDEKVQYTNTNEYANIALRETKKDEPLKIEATSPFKNPDTPLTIYSYDQSKHIIGGAKYNEYMKKNQYSPSYLTITEEQAQKLVDKYHGTGILKLDKKGNVLASELIVDNEDIIGYVVNNLNGNKMPVTAFKIHYSSKGTHIVPTYENQKMFWKKMREENEHDWLLRQKS